MQAITDYNRKSKEIFELACPKCKKSATIGVPAFLLAINKQERFYCTDCKSFFIVKIELLEPPARTPDTADLGQTCPACSGVGSYFVGVYRETCSECEGTGHV